MNRPPEPNYAAPLPQRRDTANHRQADLYRYDMETEGARIHVEVWLHEEITPPQSAEISLQWKNYAGPYGAPQKRPGGSPRQPSNRRRNRRPAWRKEKQPNAPSTANISAAPTSAGARPRAGVTMYATRQKIKIAQVYPAGAA